jgi:hypothetical protein
MLDKRRWTTPEQRDFLSTYVPRYLEAQASRKYTKFWPTLYQAWFAKFPEPEPREDDPSETEVEDDSEPDALSESESESGHPSGSAGSKRKRSVRRAKALKKKARSLFYSSAL